MISLVLVDDHRALVNALGATLQALPDYAVLGRAHDVASGEAMIDRRRPDVAVVGLRLRDGSGADLACRVADSGIATRVLIYTGVDDPVQLRLARDCGADGVALKCGDLDALTEAITAVANGKKYLDPALGDLPDDRLRPREREIVELVASGLSDEEIAARLLLSVHTVRTHMRNVRARLGARTRSQVIALAVRPGEGQD